MNGWERTEPEPGVLRFCRDDGTELLAPAVIGERYLPYGVLSASGGFGVIFLANDDRLAGHPVLVKARRYPPELFRFPEDRARNETIARLRAQTRFEWQCLLRFRRHGESRIPSVNDICTGFAPALVGPHKDADGKTWTLEDQTITHTEPYLILQAIPGRSLHDHIDEGRRDASWERQVLQLALELCTILGGFHRPMPQGGGYFIYQDLKPANIIISHDEFFTLIDFGGMTLVMNDETGRPWSNWEGLGSPGLGTWGYKAPEMNPEKGLLGQLDRRVDVYALGATLFHLLTGEDPSRQPQEYGPLPLDRLRTRTPMTAALVRRALEMDRERRYAAMEEMRQDIFEALRELRQM